MNMQQRKALAWGLVGLVPVVGISAYAQGAVTPEYRWLTFTVFAAIISLTMYVTYVASKRVKSASDFYTAGGGVTGLQNGWAIAGDYLSAASFLGIAGLISQYGYDGFMYSVGWLVAYITVLLVIAEPCRNIGRYTLSDILAYRNNPKAMRIVGALSVITVSTFYLTAQMVGGGVLVKTLIGIDYEVSVIAVGVLMLAYVLFGGMVATTWVQIIKAILLVIASLVLVVHGLAAVRLLAAGVPGRTSRPTRKCRRVSPRCSVIRRRRCRRPNSASASSSRACTSRRRSTRSRSAWRWCSARPACRTS